MSPHRLVILCLLLPLVAFAQNAEDFRKVRGRADLRNPSGRQQFLARYQSRLPEGTTLRLVAERESPAGHHFTFEQYYRGLPVWHGLLKANCGQNGQAYSVWNHLKTHGFPAQVRKTSPPEPRSAYRLLNPGQPGQHQMPLWYPSGSGLVKAMLKVHIGAVESHQEALLIIGPSGDTLHRENLLRYHHQQSGPDSLEVAVYRPDPVTVARQPYGAPYVDNNDADTPALTAALDTVKVPADSFAGGYRFHSPYIRIVDRDFPKKGLCQADSSRFLVTRGDPCFEQANAFYHLHFFQKYVQSQGFNNLMNRPLDVDVHALDGKDQSAYSPSNSLLMFGEGNVDDAEDADVLIHEYTHALIFDAVAFSSAGMERRAIDEGICDYMAASYSKAFSDYRSDWVYNWDGHNEFWSGRSVATTKQYPRDLSGNMWSDAEIFSSALMAINEKVGRPVSDRLVMQTFFSFSPEMTMPQAAELLLQADSLLYNEGHTLEIRDAFVERGVLDRLPVALPAAQNSGTAARVWQSGNQYRIRPKGQGRWQLLSAHGQLLRSGRYRGAFGLGLSGQPAGVYLLRLLPENGRAPSTHRLVKP